MIAASLLLLLLGLVAGVVLAIASRVFYVWEDPKVLALGDVLPGANCGGCGFAGCVASAEAIAAGKAPINVCVVGGLEVAQAVGEIMGQKAEAREPDFSWTSCTYGVGEADPIYLYNGAMDCRAAVMLYGGSKQCPVGCIGLGTCVRACQFGALKMGEDNLPLVDYARCVGCGACVEACPKKIVSLTSATRRIQGEYTLKECTAPCQRTCPTGIAIPKYIREIRQGKYQEALLTIKEKCPLPLVCGYICPAPCELACRRNLADEPVAIDLLKRFAADYQMATGKSIQPYKAPDNGRRIAVVGGGSEGLTASYYLARLGYNPTILEAKPELGGILRYVIAEDRLPRNVLDNDIKAILDTGVEAKTNVMIGRDFTVRSLLAEDYEAVILTTGGFDSRKVLHADQKIYATPVKGLHLTLDFLATLKEDPDLRLRGRVMLISCGTKALELAFRCRKMGADMVTIVCWEEPDALPAEFNDAKALKGEGVDVRTSTSVAAISGIEKHLTSVDLIKKAPALPSKSDKDIQDVDFLFFGGARLPELVFVHTGGKPPFHKEEVEWHTIESFRTFPGGEKNGIFTPPEPGRLSDSSAVVKSILSGRRLARAVHQYFSTEQITPIENLACEAGDILDVKALEGVSSMERNRPPRLDVEGDSKTAWIFPEILPGLVESAAQREAERCLQCGLICYRKDH
ncbi:MAG: (Fe-S)-binding protein [Pseudomonadota bacterium]